MNTSIINFDYKGSQISFSNGEKGMVNATEMAKSFGKRPVKWLITIYKRVLISINRSPKIGFRFGTDRFNEFMNVIK